MSATTSGALKAYIEGLGLGISAYRDRAPAGATLPYVTILEEVGLSPDPYEAGALGTLRETAQVDLWQTWRNLTTDVLAESLTLAPALKSGLQMAKINFAPDVVYAVVVRGSRRLLEIDTNTVHHAITCEIFRQF
jgi:hypothetical protein